jgi:hypothetical protein
MPLWIDHLRRHLYREQISGWEARRGEQCHQNDGGGLLNHYRALRAQHGRLVNRQCGRVLPSTVQIGPTPFARFCAFRRVGLLLPHKSTVTASPRADKADTSPRGLATPLLPSLWWNPFPLPPLCNSAAQRLSNSCMSCSNFNLSDAVLAGLYCACSDDPVSFPIPKSICPAENCLGICANPDLAGIGVRTAFYAQSVMNGAFYSRYFGP